jgi:hypothetical protein
MALPTFGHTPTCELVVVVVEEERLIKFKRERDNNLNIARGTIT